jgi:hypothetical protein
MDFRLWVSILTFNLIKIYHYFQIYWGREMRPVKTNWPVKPSVLDMCLVCDVVLYVSGLELRSVVSGVRSEVTDLNHSVKQVLNNDITHWQCYLQNISLKGVS